MTDDHLDDARAELVLAEARRVGVDAGTDPLVQVMAEIRQTFSDAPAAPDRARIAALAATAAAAAAERRPLPARRRAFRPAFVAAAAAGCLGVTVGLAAGEQLPAPAQRLVANVAEVVGVDLPDPDEESDEGPEVTVARRDPSPTAVTTGKGERQDRGQPPTTVLPPGDRGADPAVTSGSHGPPLSSPSATAPGSTGSTSPAATAPGSTAPGATVPGSTAPGSTAPRGRPEDPGASGQGRAELGKPEKISG